MQDVNDLLNVDQSTGQRFSIDDLFDRIDTDKNDFIEYSEFISAAMEP